MAWKRIILGVTSSRNLATAVVCSFLSGRAHLFLPSSSLVSAFMTTATYSTPFLRTAAAASRIRSTTTFTNASTRGASTTVATDTTCDASIENPLLADWSSQPFLLPPFAIVEASHYEPALVEGMKLHLQDLQNIVDDSEESNFHNTIAAYDRAGRVLSRARAVFSNMCSSRNDNVLQAVQTKIVPVLSRHGSQARFLPGLFDRIEAVFQKRHDLNLTPEQLRLTERIHMDFTRAGAALPKDQQDTLADLSAELASLTTKFTQNVMKDEETYELVLQKDDLAGCPESLMEAAQMAAAERNKADGDYVITLSRSLVEPFLTFSQRRDLRQQAWKAWTSRGELHPDRDNSAIATEILKLRQKVAAIHGYKSFAAYQCADRMAQTPENVMELLKNVWERAKVVANQEKADLEVFVKESGEVLNGGIEPWDWRYYAEKVRKAKYDFDESLLKPYLSLEQMTNAIFAVSGNLFGLSYVKRDDIQAYHEDVDVYEVRETSKDGKDRVVAIFVHDNFARPFKTSGAWMSEYRSQTRNIGDGVSPIEAIPVVSNNNNLAKSGSHTLLSYDDARTLFHEFGHAHHGMLSDANYGRLASTNVATDFVELPSQLMEHWLDERTVLKEYARHYQTGEPVPDDLLDKLEAARSFQQGFQTVEYTICALLDMAIHQIEDYSDFNLADFERAELARLGMPAGIVMRHRPAHFQHLFSTSMYAAGYYVYQWAEVLDADAFAAFTEAGDAFDSSVAQKARSFIYGAGNTVAPDELFRQFRGRDPDINFMLKKKGLLIE
jgi:peptidyl-dipeptidase Dcp